MITQLMQEVDLVKWLSHPSIVKYEGMAQDENHHPASATSSRGSLDRERTNSPKLSSTTSPAPPHPPVAHKILAPSKRSRRRYRPTQPIPTRLSHSRL